MRVPTIKLRNRGTGQVIVVNESDYILGSIPGVCIGSGWDRIGETHGDPNDEHLAFEAAAATRKLVEAQAIRGAELDRMNKVFRHGS